MSHRRLLHTAVGALLLGVLLGLPGLGGAASRTIGPGDSLQSAVSQLGPGDTLLLQTGTYPCSHCLDGMTGGTSSAPVTIAAAPGAHVTIQFQGGGNGITFARGDQSYITFEGLRFDASGASDAGIKITCGGGGDYAHHIRFVNIELFGAGTQGILANAGQCNASNQGHNEVMHSDIHHNGNDPQFDHGLYFASSDNVIQGNKIHDNSGCGVHIYASAGSADRNLVENNRAYGHTGQCGVGILMGSGDGNVAAHNVSDDNNGGLMIGNGGQGNQATDNRLAGNHQWCVRDDNAGTVLQNNACDGQVPPDTTRSGPDGTAPPPGGTPPPGDTPSGGIAALPAPRHLRLISQPSRAAQAPPQPETR